MVRIQPPLLRFLDEWILSQDVSLTRPQAIRRLIEIALSAKIKTAKQSQREVAEALTARSRRRLDDLKVAPANRLEKLKGNLKDFYSIRINDQWRVIFKWANSEAHDVRITDYH